MAWLSSLQKPELTIGCATTGDTLLLPPTPERSQRELGEPSKERLPTRLQDVEEGR